MTRPVGELRADLIVTSDKVEQGVRDGLQDAGKVSDREAAKIGHDIGETIDEEIQDATKNTGRDLARSISAGIEREGFRVTKVTQQIDADGNLVRRWLTSELIQGEKAVGELAASGAFNKIGSAISDAIGASFNISGRSPLIALLIPVIGFIVELVGAAVQAVASLVAVLALVPNLIFAIGVQVGVLVLAFKGLGTAIQGAFEAKNAEELNEAIKNLTPSAQEFVRDLLPIRDFFKSLSTIAQEAFFSKLGDVLNRIVEALGPQLPGQVSAIASALGSLFDHVLSFFASPVFGRFLTAIIPSIIKWLDDMGPALFSFLFGLTTFGNALIPFLTWFGETFTEALSDIGGWLNNLSRDQSFLDWLDRMKETFKLTGQVILDIGAFLAMFAGALDRAGGNELLKALSEQLLSLGAFFASDVGVKSLEGLIHAAIFLSQILVGLVAVVALIFGVFEALAEFLNVLFTQWIPQWFQFSGQKIIDFVHFLVRVIGDFFTNKIPEFFEWIGGYITNFFNDLFDFVGAWIIRIIGAIGTAIGAIISFIIFDLIGGAIFHVGQAINDFIGWVGGIGGRIVDAVGDFFGLLYQKGRDLIQGLINGILSMVGAVGGAIGSVVAKVRGYLPSSPAKEGPLSGSGDPMKSGQTISERLAAGIEMGLPDVRSASNSVASSVMVGPGAVQMNFYGQTPTPQQAASIGGAAGGTLADVLAARNARLAVRTQ